MTTTEWLMAAWAVIAAAVFLVAAVGIGYWLRGLVDDRRARRAQEHWDWIRQRAAKRVEELEFTEPEPPIAKQVIPQNRFTLPVEDLYRPGDYANPQACAECEVPFTAGQAVLQFGSGALHTLVCLRCGDELPEIGEVSDGEKADHEAAV